MFPDQGDWFAALSIIVKDALIIEEIAANDHRCHRKSSVGKRHGNFMRACHREAISGSRNSLDPARAHYSGTRALQ